MTVPPPRRSPPEPGTRRVEHDDDLVRFEAEGALPLLPADAEGHVEHDEVIHAEHAAQVAASRPNGELLRLEDVGSFAPVLRPALFDGAVAAILDRHGR